jgi:hypothetical protein
VKIGGQPHFARWFFDPNGRPNERCKAAVNIWNGEGDPRRFDLLNRELRRLAD